MQYEKIKKKKKQEANTGGGVSVMGDAAASGEGTGDDRGKLPCPGEDDIPGMIGQFSIADWDSVKVVFPVDRLIRDGWMIAALHTWSMVPNAVEMQKHTYSRSPGFWFDFLILFKRWSRPKRPMPDKENPNPVLVV
jgi:hypothetical protein